MAAQDSLHPKQFMKKHQPGEYAHTWRGVASNAEFLKGNSGGSIESLIEDIDQKGIQNPVTVSRGVVVEGHHRVIAAAVTGKEVPFQEAHNPEDYAEQVSRARKSYIEGTSRYMPSAAPMDKKNVPPRLREYLGWKK